MIAEVAVNKQRSQGNEDTLRDHFGVFAFIQELGLINLKFVGERSDIFHDRALFITSYLYAKLTRRRIATCPRRIQIVPTVESCVEGGMDHEIRVPQLSSPPPAETAVPGAVGAGKTCRNFENSHFVDQGTDKLCISALRSYSISSLSLSSTFVAISRRRPPHDVRVHLLQA